MLKTGHFGQGHGQGTKFGTRGDHLDQHLLKKGMVKQTKDGLVT